MFAKEELEITKKNVENALLNMTAVVCYGPYLYFEIKEVIIQLILDRIKFILAKHRIKKSKGTLDVLKIIIFIKKF